MFAFITKTKAGYMLEVRTSSDYSRGEEFSKAVYTSKPLAKQAAKLVGAKAWNY
jgi:hypothetical protein